MIKRKLKHWHLLDFKETAKFMYIVLDEDFHKKFYSASVDTAGGQRKLAKKLGVYSSRINNYIHLIRRPSLNTIIEISKFLVNNGKSEFDMNEIEKHVIKIKVNGQPVFISPKLPIILNEDLVRIVAHIIGDGGITKCCDPFYSNNDVVLLNNFKKYMKNVFRCAALREHNDQIWYPRITGKMLVEMFGKFAFGKSPKYIPEQILNLDKNMKTQFLNSLYGDEGSSSPYQVTLCQGRRSVKLLEQVRYLLEELDIKTNNILKIKEKHMMKDPYTEKEYQADEMYLLAITGYKEIMKFKDKVAFPENSNKSKNFLNMLKTKYKGEVKRNKVGETRDLILDIITLQPKTVEELCSLLKFSKRNVYHHIKELKSQNKIAFENGLIKLKRR